MFNKNLSFYYIDLADHSDIKKYYAQCMANIEYDSIVHQDIYPDVSYSHWFFHITNGLWDLNK